MLRYQIRDVFRTNDPIELFLAMVLLKDAVVEHLVMEGNTPGFEGMIGIFLYRLIVLGDD